MFDRPKSCKLFRILREVDFCYEIIVYVTDDLADCRRLLAKLESFNVSGHYRIDVA